MCKLEESTPRTQGRNHLPPNPDSKSSLHPLALSVYTSLSPMSKERAQGSWPEGPSSLEKAAVYRFLFYCSVELFEAG